ncbi:MAG TPA: glutathione S-transferase family protein [Rhizomicrobium sp.]|jgi:glutathione S-transferase|nr:glutathione S-transferase family protein [Rhizomicrobium sp.]
MSLKLYFHPLSSFSQKVLIALYENDTPFEPHILNFQDEASRREFLELWPIGKFPVLKDETRDWMVPETSIIIEYLDHYYPGPTRFIPADANLARQMRLRDRFFDLYIDTQVQKIVGDRLRAEGQRDPFGVDEARRLLSTALELVDQAMGSKKWAAGTMFSMADCAAAPALWYANEVQPSADKHPNVHAYLRRLMARPSFARVLREAEPYLHLFPR